MVEDTYMFKMVFFHKTKNLTKLAIWTLAAWYLDMRQFVITRQSNCDLGAKTDIQVTSFLFFNSSNETARLTQKDIVCSRHRNVEPQTWFHIAKSVIVEAIEYHIYKTVQTAKNKPREKLQVFDQYCIRALIMSIFITYIKSSVLESLE